MITNLDIELSNNNFNKNNNVKTTVIDMFDESNPYFDPKAKLTNNNIDIFNMFKSLDHKETGNYCPAIK